MPYVSHRDRGPQRHTSLMHHAGRRRARRPHPDGAPQKAPQGRDGALHFRSSAGLPDLRGEWRLRIAGHGGRRRPARRSLWLRWCKPRFCEARRRRQRRLDAEGRNQSLLHLRSVEMHRVFALRARLRGGAGHVRADDFRPWFREPRVAGDERGFFSRRNVCRAAPACRPVRRRPCPKNR